MALHKRKFRVHLAGHALMYGYVEVEAFTEEEAEEAALEKTGDVIWSYDRMVDDTVEVVATSLDLDQL